MFIGINETGAGLRNKISSMPKSPGICIFIDLCNSTNLKYSPKEKWITIIWNSFSIITSSLFISSEHIIKYIGDEIMIYIPESDMSKLNGETYDTILSNLKCMISTNFENKLDDLTLRSKASIHYCSDAYNLTFHEGFNDFYGLDIDLTARLMKKTIEGRVVISDTFYNKLTASDSRSELKGKYIEDFKGINGHTEFWIYP